MRWVLSVTTNRLLLLTRVSPNIFWLLPNPNLPSENNFVMPKEIQKNKCMYGGNCQRFPYVLTMVSLEQVYKFSQLLCQKQATIWMSKF
jgi:hypothetical protein